MSLFISNEHLVATELKKRTIVWRFKLMRRAVFQSVVSILVILASVPIAQFAVRSGFTLASALIVPTVMLGIWLSISSRRRTNRIGWFAFVMATAVWMPTCPWWKSQIENSLVRIQQVVSSSAYSGMELAAVIALFLLPWGVACASGTFAAFLAKKLLAARAVVDREQADTICWRGPFWWALTPPAVTPPAVEVPQQDHSDFRFTLREMLLALAAFGALTAWLSSPVHQWKSQQANNQSHFLTLFKDSFTSGNVVLLARPEITEVITSFLQGGINPTGIHEYRIVAPIQKDNQRLWAVWTYTYDERYKDTVSKYGYAEASTHGQLPPLPLTEYLSEPIAEIIDGEPQLRWPKALILEAPKSIKADETITVIANARWGTQCQLVVHPFHAVSSPAPIQNAPQSGPVRWQWKLDPKFKGSQIQFEILARIAPLYRATSVFGSIEIERPKAK
jgi:hypothetical protein